MGNVRAALALAASLAACGAPAEEAPDAEAADVAGDAREAVGDARDAVGDAWDAVGDARDAVGDARDAVGDARDAAGDARDAATGVTDTATDVTDAGAPRCPAEMTLVAGRVCVDRWEGTLEELAPDGGVSAWSPYLNPGTRAVRAASRAGVTPQGYVSGAQAQTACRNAGKRLCALDEWLAACRGPAMRTYPYGMTYAARRCNEGRAVHPVVQFFGTATGVFTFENMNNPGINMQADTVARTGAFAGCVSPDGAFDMVGNLHEWIADPSGTFKGGFYVDAERNGPGCLYTTTAHDLAYHDYSTGFRCCADPSRAP
ncbi:MAG: SUMF1/EgtB/PvdO family nonheme iron enzyme [Polyangiales bacterium]